MNQTHVVFRCGLQQTLFCQSIHCDRCNWLPVPLKCWICTEWRVSLLTIISHFIYNEVAVNKPMPHKKSNCIARDKVVPTTAIWSYVRFASAVSLSCNFPLTGFCTFRCIVQLMEEEREKSMHPQQAITMREYYRTVITSPVHAAGT